MGVSSLRQSGSKRSRAEGSITAPDMMWAPTSEPFSTTTTEMSVASCFSRIAAARPEGPAPTTTTSNSIDSRAGISITNLRRAPVRRGAVFPRLPACRNQDEMPCRKYANSLPMSIDRLSDLRALLAFYVEAGVDAVLEEAPVNRFTAETPQPRSSQAPAAEPSSSPQTPPRTRSPFSGPAEVTPNVRSRLSPAGPDVPPAPDAAIMAARHAAAGA